jgi:uncharacterized protein
MIKRNPVLTYFIMTFAISWGGIIGVMSRTGGIPTTKEQFAAQLPIAILAMLGGPSVAGLLLTGLVKGREGFRQLRSRLFKWQVGWGWYAIALLTGPLVLLGTLLVLSLFSPIYAPGIFAVNDKVAKLLFGLTAALVTGICEELGWSGFAVPRLRQRYSILNTGLILGVIWGAWHIMGQVVMASSTFTGGLSLPVFLIGSSVGLLIGQLPAYRILMVWVYERTGSLLVMMLMHLGLTASALIFEPLAITGIPLFIYTFASAAVMWGLVAVVSINKGGIR